MMASVANATRRLLAELLALGPDAGRTSELVERMVAWLDASVESAMGAAAEVVPPGATLLGCSYSSVVLRTVELCAQAGRPPTVVLLENVSGQRAAGRRQAAELGEMRIELQVVGTEGLIDSLEGATLALVGADAVTPAS